jgi:hypothetical protein
LQSAPSLRLPTIMTATRPYPGLRVRKLCNHTGATGSRTQRAVEMDTAVPWLVQALSSGLSDWDSHFLLRRHHQRRTTQARTLRSAGASSRSGHSAVRCSGGERPNTAPRRDQRYGRYADLLTAAIGVLVCVAIAGSMRSRDRKMRLGRFVLRRQPPRGLFFNPAPCFPLRDEARNMVPLAVEPSDSDIPSRS